MSYQSSVIDCITHNLTGPAILAACGIMADGTVLYADENQMPVPQILMIQRGSAEKKLNTIRVAASTLAKESNSPRFFEITAGYLIHAMYIVDDVTIPVEYMILGFTRGGNRMKMAAAFRQIGGLHND